MSRLKIFRVFALIGLASLVGGFSFFGISAPSAAAATVEELRVQLEILMMQVASLQAQLAASADAGTAAQGSVAPMPLAAGAADFSATEPFLENLGFGMRAHPGVRRLQQFLIKSGYLSFGLDTGNYFQITKAAVAAYQGTHGIAATGYFGPLTRAQANSELVTDLSLVVPVVTPVPTPVPPPAAGSTVTPVPTLLPTATPSPTLTPAPTPAPANAEEPRLISEQDGFHVYAKPAYDFVMLSRRIQELVNEERLKAGIAPIAWSDDLAGVALLHSKDQAPDNAVITDPHKPCSYPYIRHEGFSSGFTLGERLRSRGIPFRIAGENIAAYNISKKFIYQYKSTDEPIRCAPFPEPAPAPAAGETQEAARTRVDGNIAALRRLVEPIREVIWVNQEWQTRNEIAREIVDGWMNSEGHRRNMLDSRFLEGGIGVAEVNDYVIATHVLAARR